MATLGNKENLEQTDHEGKEDMRASLMGSFHSGRTSMQTYVKDPGADIIKELAILDQKIEDLSVASLIAVFFKIVKPAMFLAIS